jgi:hypothetical protein
MAGAIGHVRYRQGATLKHRTPRKAYICLPNKSQAAVVALQYRVLF